MVLTSVRVPSHRTLASPPGAQITSIGRLCTSPWFELATSDLEMIWIVRPPVVAEGWLVRWAGAGAWVAELLLIEDCLLPFRLLAPAWMLAGSILRGLLGL